MQVFIIGSNGFIGSKLFEVYSKEQNQNVVGVNRQMLDFMKHETFNNISLNRDDIIIDCITCVDGSEEDIKKINIDGFSNFLNYILLQNRRVKYIYISTYSVLLPDIVSINPYVKSKSEAEHILKSSGLDYIIIRLIFPFGQGENPNRLISSLINKIKSDQSLIIDKLTFNLTPISAFVKDFPELIEAKEKEINYSVFEPFYLPEIVSFIYQELGKQESYNISNKEQKIALYSPFKTKVKLQSVWDELKEMIHV